ncbi:hypothetical protein EZJ43_11505 [Pedobacter changchengzhani]|uniref:DUF4468 domain-containing protein n=1 Tax=Pedobacter changchengzhani TaxID=2529274 RepID=A0A4R5MJW2_9SPHI|nr:hypothetical protein [Pedobacter changchengzhani]TDG35967.1 hypothetical protein EZJ43_11505 [Pedobacter changchengzhani]
MFKIILIFCCAFTINAQAQKSITYSYAGLGINPSSGYKTITENGKIITKTSKKFNKDSLQNIPIEKIAISKVTPLFLLVDSILTLNKTSISLPYKTGGYGLQKITYFNGKTETLLFGTIDWKIADDYEIKIKKEKNKVRKKQLSLEYDHTKKLVGLYKKMYLMINECY